MNKFKFEIGDRVFINYPNDPKYNGMLAEVEDIEMHGPSFYTVSVLRKDGTKMRNKLYLPEKLLRQFKQKTLSELEPGDILVNKAGLEFEVKEPQSPVYFISPINTPSVTVHVSALELFSDGFSIKDRKQ